MPDDWVRSPTQQAAIDLQASIDARPPSDVVVRTYPGPAAQAYADFQIDAAQMMPAGWQPIAQQYIPGSPSVAGVAFLGLLAFAAKPPGSLIVTYQYQRTPAPSAANASPV